MVKKTIKKRFLSSFDGKKREWLHTGLLLAVMLLAAFAVFQLVFGISTVSGASMEPGFHDGDVVLYLRLGNTYKIGDIVAISMPSGESYIKQISGVPGDVLELRDGVLIRNGSPEEPCGQYGSTTAQVNTVKYPLRVSAGRYFVLGSNREASVDSRTFGTVTQKQIRGRVLFTLRRGK